MGLPSTTTGSTALSRATSSLGLSIWFFFCVHAVFSCYDPLLFGAKRLCHVSSDRVSHARTYRRDTKSSGFRKDPGPSGHPKCALTSGYSLGPVLVHSRKCWGHFGESAGLFDRVNLRLGGFLDMFVGMGQFSCCETLKGIHCNLP